MEIMTSNLTFNERRKEANEIYRKIRKEEAKKVLYSSYYDDSKLKDLKKN